MTTPYLAQSEPRDANLTQRQNLLETNN